MNLTQMTSKGQITIPREIRKALDLNQGDRLFFLVDGERAVLIPLHHGPLSELLGALPATRPDPGMDKIRRAARRELGRRLAEEE